MTVSFLFSCGNDKNNAEIKEETKTEVTTTNDFNYNVEQFADIKVLRYQIPGWKNLTLKGQKLVYYLTQAGLAGRDIIWDQNYRQNLKIRKALENVYVNYGGDKSSNDWNAFMTYLKRVWFSNGIHHHYSNDKLKPEFSSDYLKTLLSETNTVLEGEAFDVIFNDKDNKKVNQAKDVDNVALSAINFYGPNVTNEDVETFYGKTYFNINDYEKLHNLFGQLLRETQRIKSEGDFKAVEALVEGYGVKVDQDIHTEVLERNKQFPSPPYSGFVNPVLVPETNEAGEITAIKVTQPDTFDGQMLEYSKKYSFLPEVN